MEANSNPPVTIIDRLKSSLSHKGINITQLSEHLGVSRQAIYNWMRSGSISQKYVARISKLLDVSAEWLVFGTPQADCYTSDCFLSCELKNTLVELLLESSDLVAEHDILTQSIIWHHKPDNHINSSVLPNDSKSMRDWIDSDYYHMFHHALLRYHLYQDKQKVIFPLQAGHIKRGRWLELDFKSQCNNQIIYYTIRPFNP